MKDTAVHRLFEKYPGILPVLGCSSALLFAAGPHSDSITIFIIPLVKAFHWSRAQVSEIDTASRFMAGALSPLVGWLVDKYGARSIIAVGLVIFAFGYIAGSFIDSLWQLVACFALVGCAYALTFRIPFSVVAINWFRKRSGTASAIGMLGNSLGMVITPVLLNWVIVSYGWRAGIRWMSVPILLIALPMTLLLVRTRPAVADAETPSAEIARLPGLDVSSAVRTSAFWYLMIGEFLFAMASGGIMVHRVPYFIGLGISSGTAAFAQSATPIFGGLGILLAGFLSDRWGVKPVLSGLMFIGGLGILCLISASNPHIGAIGVIGAVMLLGAPFGGISIFLPILIAHSLGLRRLASLAGIIFFVATAAAALGPVLSGWLFDQTNSYTPPFLIGMVFAIGAATAIALVRPAKGSDEVPEISDQPVADGVPVRAPLLGSVRLWAHSSTRAARTVLPGDATAQRVER